MLLLKYMKLLPTNMKVFGWMPMSVTAGRAAWAPPMPIAKSHSETAATILVRTALVMMPFLFSELFFKRSTTCHAFALAVEFHRPPADGEMGDGPFQRLRHGCRTGAGSQLAAFGDRFVRMRQD